MVARTQLDSSPDLFSDTIIELAFAGKWRSLPFIHKKQNPRIVLWQWLGFLLRRISKGNGPGRYSGVIFIGGE